MCGKNSSKHFILYMFVIFGFKTYSFPSLLYSWKDAYQPRSLISCRVLETNFGKRSWLSCMGYMLIFLYVSDEAAV